MKSIQKIFFSIEENLTRSPQSPESGKAKPYRGSTRINVDQNKAQNLKRRGMEDAEGFVQLFFATFASFAVNTFW
jgi:hypothetical protein